MRIVTGITITLVMALPVVWGCGQRNEPSLESQEKSRQALTGDEQKRFENLTIARIMQGPGVVGTAPETPRFSADGSTVYFNWNSPRSLDSLNTIDPGQAYQHYLDLEHEKTTWALDTRSGGLYRLGPVASDSLAADEWAWDRSRRHRAEIRAGDVYLVDTASRRITGTAAIEHGVQISPDGATVYFIRDGNVFRVAWDGGPITQVTNIVASDDPDEEEQSAQRQYLADQQKELFVHFRERPEQPEPFVPVYIGDGFSVESALVSPSGRYVAFAITKDASGTRSPLVPLAVTESGYVETEEARPKVGEARDDTRVVILDVPGDSLLSVEADESMWVSVMSWSPAADILLVRAITADWHDRYFMTVDPRQTASERLSLRELDHYHDDAWTGGPEFYRTGEWLPDGTGIYFTSEVDGWGHLYTATTDGQRTQITSGEWEVQSVWIDPDRPCWYIVSNEGRWGSSRLWRMNLDGSSRRLLTPEAGGYEVAFSGDMSAAAVLHSTVNLPPEIYLFDVRADEMRGPFTESTTKLFREFAWEVPEDVNFKASDGARVPAHLFKPTDFGAEANGAGVIFIHGAGYLQNVTDFWGHYYREYMFNNFLASRGYTVLNVDFRGSAGYGRACRTAIYKHMGGRDLDDIVDGAQYLMDTHGVGQHQVGVYGGSYGGFLTLMALFKNGDTIEAGAALRSVTDWAHYNHWYTSRILGIPEDDPEAFRRSSPIYFADGLEGHLVMLHGLRDSNVLAQDVLRLSQRLIELGKENWELALHPVESHGYKAASSWTDQMTRAWKLFERVLPDDAPQRRK